MAKNDILKKFATGFAAVTAMVGVASAASADTSVLVNKDQKEPTPIEQVGPVDQMKKVVAGEKADSTTEEERAAKALLLLRALLGGRNQ